MNRDLSGDYPDEQFWIVNASAQSDGHLLDIPITVYNLCGALVRDPVIQIRGYPDLVVDAAECRIPAGIAKRSGRRVELGGDRLKRARIRGIEAEEVFGPVVELVQIWIALWAELSVGRERKLAEPRVEVPRWERGVGNPWCVVADSSSTISGSHKVALQPRVGGVGAQAQEDVAKLPAAWSGLLSWTSCILNVRERVEVSCGSPLS